MSIGSNIALLEYLNVPAIIGTIVSSRLATLAELQSVYSAEDAYNFLEIISINNYNEAKINGNSD